MDEKTQRRGIFSKWTEESARWFEDAYLHSDYHRILAEKIAEYVPKNSVCCELACGNGSLARSLAPFVKQYTANDIDANATAWLRKKIDEEHIENINVIEGDWKKVLSGMHFDAVVFSYFGAIMDGWPQLEKLAGKQIVAISPRTDGNFFKKKFKHNHAQESYEDIVEFLTGKGIDFHAEPLDLELGQPFYNEDDVRKYVEYYYSHSVTDIDAFIDEKIEKTDFGWYFPKKKEIGLVIANL